ncbi:DUF4136 domain-containing protein [Parerythrobacter aestuarii]|uniref:DUF4136 domain-containing protein n=1 Tax=Parerythrobacter aestuarii TaxID=3020909 RepID=UPI0024DEFB01|nr:DUF4136 domain-containing protein [Parerythrobacter aestuarii]
MTTPTSLTRRLIRAIVVPFALLSLSACATPGFKTDVTRFSSKLPAPQGQSFAVVADDPALEGGLEFSQYAELVSAEMARLGYTPAPPETASLLVRFDYGVDKGRERVRSNGLRDPFFDPWFGYYGRSRFYRSNRFRGAWGFGFYDPWFGEPSVRSYTVYTSGIDLKINDTATGERLFEGKAEALSTSNRLQYLVPNLVEAMFTDFPGNSGETVRISVRPEG